MSQRVSENIVICFDVSRSMYRKDYLPNRLNSCKKALQYLVSARLQKDPSTSFAIIAISDTPKLVLDFNNNEEKIIEKLNNIEFAGRSALGNALDLGIQKLIDEWKPQILIVGLPLNMDGTEQKMTKASKKFGNRLNGRFQIPVEWQDERLTTFEALEHLGIHSKLQAKQRDDVDRISAQLILQSWLNEQ